MGAPVKYPARQKYKPAEEKAEVKKEEPISPEEHQRRLELLKSIGLIK